jgi:hypothetical protein
MLLAAELVGTIGKQSRERPIWVATDWIAYRGRGCMSGLDEKVSRSFLQRVRLLMAHLGPPRARQCGARTAKSTDRGNAARDQVLREGRQSLGMIIRPPVLDGEILTLKEADFSQARME